MQKSLHYSQILRAIFTLDVNSMGGYSGSLNLWPKQLKPDFAEFVVEHQKLRFARFAVYHFPFPRCQGFKKYASSFHFLHFLQQWPIFNQLQQATSLSMKSLQNVSQDLKLHCSLPVMRLDSVNVRKSLQKYQL